MSDKLQGGIKAGSTDVSLPVEIRSSSDSTALTGLSNTDITAYYWRQGGTATSVTDSALGSVNAAHTDGGFIEVDATNMPGIYRFDIPDAAVATGADWVVITLEATGGFAESFMLNLTTNVVQTGDAFGRLGSPAGASVSADIATVDTVADAVKAVTDNLPDSGALSSLPSADKLLAYVQLLARSDAAISTDRSAELAEINANEGTGAGDYDQETDAQEAIRDRGDSAWITGGGGGITQILNLQPVLPFSIDLANTATVRLGLILTNAMDDLPSTAEIAPGTISIDRKAAGGTSWISVVADAAMSEQAGMVYYDEVFDSGTGYVAGDSVRVTFKSVSITADSNTHEVCDANGIIFQTVIREHIGDGANLTEVGGTGDQLTAVPWNASWDAEVQSECADALTSYDPPTKAEMDSGFAALNDPDAATIADAVLDEALSGHVTAGTLGKAVADIETDAAAILVDTAEIGAAGAGLTEAGGTGDQFTGLPEVSADVVKISGTAAAADKLEASANTIVTGSALTGTLSTTAMTTNLTEVTDDHYNGRVIIWTSGVLTDQATDITDYDGTSKLLTFTATTEAPSNGDTFVIV